MEKDPHGEVGKSRLPKQTVGFDPEAHVVEYAGAGTTGVSLSLRLLRVGEALRAYIIF